MSNIKKILNTLKRTEGNEAVLLSERKGTEIPYWVPTGSLWLDNIIAVGKTAGIPGGHITEIAGFPASGKSYLAAQILMNAQKMNKACIWFDSENAVETFFLEKMGVDLESVIYMPANSIEDVFDNIEKILKGADNVFFVWDSVANTPAKGEWDKTFDPMSAMALQARSLSYGLRRIVNLLAKTQSTLLIVNQLKTNIGPTAMVEPFVTPCGKAIQYSAHLRLFLVSRKAKAHNIYVNGEKVGSDLIVKIRKSRFGTEDRSCELKILWGDGIRICDEESWLSVLKASPFYTKKKGSHVILNDDNTVLAQIPNDEWVERLQGDYDTRARVQKIMYQELVEKYQNKQKTIDVILNEEVDGAIHENSGSKEEEEFGGIE